MAPRGARKASRTASRTEPRLTSGAHALAAIGPHTRDVVYELAAKEEDLNLFARADDDELRQLAEAFRRWDDERAAKVVSRYLSDLQGDALTFDVDALCRWVGAHVNHC